MHSLINSFFIICENGTPLFTKTSVRDEQDNVLLSGFLSSINTFANALQKTRISQIQLDTRNYYYAVRPPIISIVEADAEDDVESRIYQVIAERLARAFLDKYGADPVTNWCGDMGEFVDFEGVYEATCTEITELLQEGRREHVSEYFVEAASDENILGVVVFDLEADEIVASDVPAEFTGADFEAFGSMLFSFIDRLGRELKAGGINEILIRAKNYWIGGFRKGQHAVFMLFSADFFGQVLPKFVERAVDDL